MALIRDVPVDPERDIFSLAGDLEDISRTGVFHALRLDFTRHVDS